MTNPTDSPETWAEHCARISANRSMFEVWRSYEAQGLRVPTEEVRAEGVHVFLSDLDDLACWYETVGGVVERGPESRGLRAWQLTVATGPEYRGLMVWVSVLGMADALVMHTLESAAAETDRRVLVPSADAVVLGREAAA